MLPVQAKGCFPHLPRAASNSFPAAGSRFIGCPLKARILEKSWAAIDKEKPAFKIEQNPRFRTGRNPLFKTAVACLLSTGSGRHGKGKNPVNGYKYGNIMRTDRSVQRSQST
jgi:hypothetical protein